jgi:hypothetical protein
VSFAWIFKTRKLPSFSKLSLERIVVGLAISGLRALTTVSKWFSDGNFNRTTAFAFNRLAPKSDCIDSQERTLADYCLKLKRRKRGQKHYSASSPAPVLRASSTGAPLATRFATTPSLVAGTYAPPVNVKPHFRHFQTPTLCLRTRRAPHCGQV